MESAIHISPIFNRQSIAQKGLIPTRIELPHHLESFKEDGMCTPDGKALYTWRDCDRTEKFIHDMIFCHLYIDPRNRLYNTPDPISIDFRKLLNTNMAPWPSMIYDVYEVEVDPPDTTYYHVQSTGDEIYSSTHGMPDEYAHEDKLLYIFKAPQKKIKIVGQAEYYYDNGHNIKVLKSVQF